MAALWLLSVCLPILSHSVLLVGIMKLVRSLMSSCCGDRPDSQGGDGASAACIMSKQGSDVM